MTTTCEEIKAGTKESLTRIGALFLIAFVAMVVVGFQFESAYKDDAPTIERADFSEE